MRSAGASADSARIAPLVGDPISEPAAVAENTEPDLVARARVGDLDAFNALVELHQRLAYNLCLRMLGSPPAAEDATQDAFLSAFRSISTFRGASFRAWLMRIAANACTDELRRRHRRPSASLDAPLPGTEGEHLDVADPAAGPEVVTLRSEQQATVQAALLLLPNEQRLAVVMCDIQGFTYEEIAEAMRTSIGTVKSRIARGRDKLRRELTAKEQSGS